MTDKELFYDELLEAMHENPLFEGASFVEREIPKNSASANASPISRRELPTPSSIFS